MTAMFCRILEIQFAELLDLSKYSTRHKSSCN